MTCRKVAVAVALVLLLFVGEVLAEPLRFVTPTTCTTDGGSVVRVEPGIYLELDLWTRLESETRRLQESETRLRAERDSYRESAESDKTRLFVGIVGGIALGFMLSEFRE